MAEDATAMQVDQDRIPGTPDGRIPGTPDGRMPGTPDGRMPGTADGRTPGTPDGLTPGMPDGRTPGTPDGRIPGTGVEPMLPPRAAGPGDVGLVAQALADGSNAALIMILARNPGTADADAALAALAGRGIPDPAAVTRAVAGADAGVVAAFDAARLIGTATAWQGFLAAHGSHPLAATARAALAAL